MASKVGVLAGTFDPVHNGHLAFAAQAKQLAGLEKVIFLPEHRPRVKSSVTDYKHRLAMLELAVKPYHDFEVLDLLDQQLSVRLTLPQLKRVFQDSHLSLLIGSDVVANIKNWPGADKLLEAMDLVIGLRGADSSQKMRAELAKLNLPVHVTFVETEHPHVSSAGLRLGANMDVSPPDVRRYIEKHHLYN